MPREYWLQERKQDLSEAIIAYAQAGLNVPIEWVCEYNLIMSELKTDYNFEVQPSCMYEK